jgi:hypothetical protein
MISDQYAEKGRYASKYITDGKKWDWEGFAGIKSHWMGSKMRAGGKNGATCVAYKRAWNKR